MKLSRATLNSLKAAFCEAGRFTGRPGAYEDAQIQSARAKGLHCWNQVLLRLRWQVAGWLAFLLILSSCGTHQTAKQAAPPVTVRRPAREPVQDYVELTGTVASYRTVDLVARVTGYLQSIHFKDGAWVEAGQLLFIIEPESYQQQLALAQASLDRARAEYERQLGLLKENATSTANVERWLSERDQAAAQVELAKLNLSYTRVTAPFPGRIGRHLVDVGNLVGPSVNTKLATLDQLVPIYINFNLNEREALRLRDLMRQHGVEPGSGVGTTPVLLGLQNQEGYPYAAKLDFVDTGVSAGSGTILMRATYTNTDQALLPGLFARVRIPVGPPQPMLVVPASALANDQEGDYLLVADATDTVVRRTVVKGPPTSEGCAIRSGLSAEDRVITRGLMQAQPGAKIKPVTEPAPGNASGPKEQSMRGEDPRAAGRVASGYRVGLVPEAHVTIAQRFSVGSGCPCVISPEGTTETTRGCCRPFGNRAYRTLAPNAEALGYQHLPLRGSGICVWQSGSCC